MESRLQQKIEDHVSDVKLDFDQPQEDDIAVIMPTTTGSTETADRGCTAEHRSRSYINLVKQCILRQLVSTDRTMVSVWSALVGRITAICNKKRAKSVRQTPQLHVTERMKWVAPKGGFGRKSAELVNINAYVVFLTKSEDHLEQ